MKRSNKSGIIASLIITISLLAILSVISWAVPFTKNDYNAFLITYICAMVLIAIEGVLVILGLFKETDGNKKVLGLPILYFGMVAVAIQVAFTITFYVVNAFIVLPIWIVIVLECLLYLFTIIFLTLGFFFKARTQEFRNNQQSTKFIDLLRANIQIALTNNSNKDSEKPLQELFETVRATDPVSSEATKEVESKLNQRVNELKEKVDANGSAEEINELILAIEKLIKERAILCKTNK